MSRPGSVAGLIAPLRVREFRTLWAAEVLSQLGDQVARIALSLLVFTQTGSAVLTGLTYALTYAPALVGGLLLSGLADRYPRRAVLITTDLVRAALAATMAIPNVALPVLWACVALLSVASGPFKAAQSALLPAVLGDRLYPAGIAVRQATVQTAQLVGFAGGGVLLGFVGPSIAMVINAATFLTSAVLVVVGVKSRPTPTASPVSPNSGRTASRLSGMTWLYFLVVLLGFSVIPEGLAAPFGHQIGSGALGVGLLMAADPVGSVVGAWISTRFARPATMLTASWFAAAGAFALIFLWPAPRLPVALLIVSISGMLATVCLVQLQAIVVQTVPDFQLGRASGRMSALMSCAQGGAVALGGVAAAGIGPARAIAATSAIAGALAIAAGCAWKLARSRRGESAPRPQRHHSRPRTGRTSSGEPDSNRDQATGSAEVHDTVSARGLRSAIARWRFWELSARARAFIVAVDVAAVAATAATAINTHISHEALTNAAMLTGLGLCVAEVGRRAETTRRMLAGAPHFNMASVWIFAVTLATTPVLGSVCAVLLYGHLWLRTTRSVSGAALYRTTFNGAVMILSTLAAAVVLSEPPGALLALTRPLDALELLLAVLAFWGVSLVLVAIAIVIDTGRAPLRDLVANWTDNLQEIATLVLGVMTAGFTLRLPLALVAIPIMVYFVHRSSVLRQIEEATALDPDTGLLTLPSWHRAATRALANAERHAGATAIVTVDIDCGTNEAGDVLMLAVADAVRSEVRAPDLVTRLGGNEFVMLLPETKTDDAARVGDRVADAVRDISENLEVCVGVAGSSDEGHSLDDLLIAAERNRAGQQAIAALQRELRNYN